MSDGDEFDREGADHDRLAELDDLHGDVGRARLAEPPRLDEFGGEAGHIDRRAQVRPKLDEGADVVLMRVGYDDPDQVLPRLLDKVEIRHDEIDAGHVLVGETYAEVDHQPSARARRPIAIKGAVHSDLAQAAKRSEHQLAVVVHLGSAFRRRRQSRLRQDFHARREREVGRLDALEPALRAQEQATVRIDPLEDAFAFAGAVLDRNPFAESERAIEPSRANAVERLSRAPGVERLVKSLDEKSVQFAGRHRLSAGARQT